MEFYTIGVYNSTEEEFFNKLLENKIDTFCDIRQRRGVRGSKYSFVNSTKLQKKLNDLGIKYGHIIGLAPNEAIRNLQKETDLINRELKSKREKLGEVFTLEYRNKILENFDFENLIENLEQIGANKIAFFCVEENHEACHRSIVANKLKELYNYNIKHL